MAQRLGLALAAAALMILGGCVSSSGPSSVSGPSSHDPTWSLSPLSTGNAATNQTPNATLDDWYVMGVRAEPGGGLASYRWTVPEGAYVPFSPLSSLAVIVLEVAPLVDPNATPPTAWSVLVFRETDGKVELLSAIAESEGTSTSRLAVLPTTGPISPSFEPTFWLLSLRFESDEAGIAEGESLYFVLAADGEPQEFGVAFRVVDHYPEFQELAASSDDFVDAQGTRPARVPPSVSSASGLQIAAYTDVNFLLAFGSDIKLGPVRVKDDLPVDLRSPAAARQVTVSAPYTSSDGWGFAEGLYIASDGAGLWSVDAEVRGERLEAQSLILQTWGAFPLLGPQILLFGLPIFVITADGTGASEAEFHLDVVDVHDNAAFLVYIKIDLGTPLKELLGVRGNNAKAVYQGLLGNVPPVEERDAKRLLVSRPDGFVVGGLSEPLVTVLVR